MKTELRNYLSVIGFNKIPIKDFYNGFVQKPAGATKQQVTKALHTVCLEMGFDLIKTASMNRRFYSFERRLNKIQQHVTLDMLLSLRDQEYLTLTTSDYNKEVKELIKKSKYVTNNRFKLVIGQDGLTRIFRTI